MKRIICLCLAALLCAPALGAMAENTPWDITNNVYTEGEIAVTDAERAAGNPIFVITLENGGQMRGELYPDVAPQAVGNFVALANSGYYDGIIFHRVIPGFVIQAGCPEGTGYGGPGWNIKGEFAINGVENDITHVTGVLSMARTNQAYDTAGSQFFIVMGDASNLDGEYAGFGRVLEGMAYAEAIVNTPRDSGNKPLEPQTIQSIRVETFGQEYPFDRL